MCRYRVANFPATAGVVGLVVVPLEQEPIVAIIAQATSAVVVLFICGMFEALKNKKGVTEILSLLRAYHSPPMQKTQLHPYWMYHIVIDCTGTVKSGSSKQ